MCFPIKFSTQDDLSQILNKVLGCAAVLAVGGVAVSAIAYIASNALGMGTVGKTIVTAIPATLAAIGSVAALTIVVATMTVVLVGGACICIFLSVVK